MNMTSHTPEIEKQDLRELEFEIGPNPDNDAVAIPYDSIRSKLIYLFSGTVLLAAWWFVYENLLPVAKFLTYHILQLSEGTHFGSTVEFFIFEVPKVLLLLTLIVFFVGIIRSFFTPERTRRILAGNRESVGHVLAGALGVVTPFCSCSAVPLFMGFLTAGVPLGVTFSFLVSAPMVNEVALVLLFGLFGWKVAGLYMATGLTIALITGVIIGRLNMEKYLEDWVIELTANKSGVGQISIEEETFDLERKNWVRYRRSKRHRFEGLAICRNWYCCRRRHSWLRA